MKILVPTDFSDHANRALLFAVNLSNQLEAQLHVVSTFEVMRPTGSFKSLEGAISNSREEEMQALLASTIPMITTDILPVSQVLSGKVVDSLLGYVKSHEIDLVIIGTQGINSASNILFGSTAKKIFQRSMAPVLAIPMDAKYSCFRRNFALAIDQEEVHAEKGLRLLASIATQLARKVDVVHLKTAKSELEIDFDPFVAYYLDAVMGEFVIKNQNNIERGLMSLVEERRYGLIAMIRRPHSWIERLFISSNTASYMMNTHVPLMMIPDSTDGENS